MEEGCGNRKAWNNTPSRAFNRAMGPLVLVATMALAAAAPALAATGTLDIGALTPQATGSRVAAEIMNTGAAARTKGGEAPPAPSVAATPRRAGQHTGGYTGLNRQ